MKTVRYLDMEKGKEYQSVRLPNIYKKENGVLYKKITGGWMVAPDSMKYIVEEMIFEEMPWTPKEGEAYWLPDYDTKEGISLGIYNNDAYDLLRQKRVGLYPTKKEALEKARELGWIKMEEV